MLIRCYYYCLLCKTLKSKKWMQEFFSSNDLSSLFSSSESEDQVEGRLLLDVVIRQSATILKLLSGKDQSLLVWWDPLLILDLCLHIFNGVWRLHLKGDGLPGQGLDKDLHATSKSENQVEGRFLLDVVIRQSSAIFQLLSSKDQPLLIWWDTLFVLKLKYFE